MKRLAPSLFAQVLLALGLATEAAHLDPAAAQAGTWQVEEADHGLASATVTTSAQYGTYSAPIAVRFQCAPGADGTLSIMLIVRDANFVPNFPFDEFEGPDAPANDLALLRVEVGTRAVAFAFDLATSGWYLDRAFIFAHAAPAMGDSPVRRIADAIAEGATHLTLGVRTLSAPDKLLLAPVPLDGATVAVPRATAACR
ncbi:MAG: hypothetical protein ACREER_00425 [Alphaproteobacteria bacterium]